MVDQVIVLNKRLFPYGQYELIPLWVYNRGGRRYIARFHSNFRL